MLAKRKISVFIQLVIKNKSVIFSTFLTFQNEARWVLESDGQHTQDATPQEDVELLCLQAIAKHSVVGAS